MNQALPTVCSMAIATVAFSSVSLAQKKPEEKQESVLPLKTEFLMQLSADLDPAQVIGDKPQGDRRILNVNGGSFSRPRLKGQVLAGGGDWLLFRKDGAAQLDARSTLRTDDGALIYVSYRGVSVIPGDVRKRIMNDEDVSVAEYYFRTTPYFETASDKYAWLNEIVTVAVGKRTQSGVVHSIYEVN